MPCSLPFFFFREIAAWQLQREAIYMRATRLISYIGINCMYVCMYRRFGDTIYFPDGQENTPFKIDGKWLD